MKQNPSSLVREAVRGLTAYHLDRHEVPLKLDQNENLLGAPDVVREDLLERLRREPLHRYPSPDQAEILQALSAHCDWPASGILVGNGSDDLLHTLAETFLEPGRSSVSPTPSFFVYAYTTRLMGAEAVEVPLTYGMQYDLEALHAAIEEHRPAVLYLCSPNNPTGCVLEPKALELLVSKAPGIVALDEAYWEFASWNGRGLLESHPNLVLFRTFSKAMALAGIRFGYLLAAPEIAREMRKAQQPYPLNRLSQAGALAALAHADLLRERAASIARERDRLHDRLREIEGVTVFPSKGNFLLFRTGLGAKKTFAGLLARGVLVRDVSAHPRLAEMLRVGVGDPEQNDRFHQALVSTLEDVP